jgi:hypothetical protein
MRRASGLANTRPPDDGTGAGAGAGVAGAFAAGCGVAFGAAGCAAGPAGAAPARADLSSPSSNNNAIGWLTGTPSVPSATSILPRMPSSTASTSMVALSVSISARTSPDSTASPSFLCHLASLPSVMVGDSAGIRIWIGMVPPSP